MNYNQGNDFRQDAENAAQMGGMLPDSMEGLTGKNMQNELASKLQTTVVGGYTKKSVEEYALEMRNNLMLIKMQLEQQIRELTAEKSQCYPGMPCASGAVKRSRGKAFRTQSRKRKERCRR